MNWLKKTFSKSDKKKAVSTSPTKALPAEMLSCSNPIKTYSKKLPSELLKKYVPLRDLDEQSINLLPHSIEVFSPESILFIKNQESQAIYYLIDGSVRLQPDSENHYEINSDDTRAHLPLNNSKICGATATALNKVTLLVISSELNQLWTNKSIDDVSCTDLIELELPQQLNEHKFFDSFSQAYRNNQLSLPSLPNVAIKLKQAMGNNIGVKEAVEIIQIDPPIVTKLIQVVNSPIYASAKPITNCHDAVTRLGLETTRTIVMSISLKQLFQCKDKQLMKSMQSLWKRSLYVSSLSFVLAAESGTINPEDALLAGLIADIGTIPLLHFAEQHPDEYADFSDLENAMPYLRGPVGTLVLHTLGFSEELTSIPHNAEDWLYDSGEQLTLTDIVILAKLHSYISLKRSKNLPYINSIPAYSKLKDGKLNPDFSLQILHKAQKRISHAMRMLA